LDWIYPEGYFARLRGNDINENIVIIMRLLITGASFLA
jgi:hypothetical protein